jgi:hypothetical protein
MAQTSSPSLSMSDNQQPNGHASNNMKSDGDVPIDPSIAQSSPTYPPHHGYSPYPPQHEMPQYAGQPMGYGRPDWAGQYAQPMYGHPPATTGGAPPNMVAHTMPRPPAVGSVFDPAPSSARTNNGPQGGHPLSTVYSFVPIPGAQQHKRPRRRYEEIERMYKCGWNGCEKAYGTLNHLNAHVTMQGHGTKRTPEGKTPHSSFDTLHVHFMVELHCCRTLCRVATECLVRAFAPALAKDAHPCLIFSAPKLPILLGSALHVSETFEGIC